MHRLTPGARVGQVHQVKEHPAGLGVKGAINQARALHGEGNVVPCDPADEVGEQIAVVGQVVAGKTPIQVRRQKGKASAWRAACSESGPAHRSSARASRLPPAGRRETRYEREPHRGAGAHLERLEQAAEG